MNNMNDDLLPNSPISCALLAALNIFKQSGIKAELTFDSGKDQSAQICIKPENEHAARMTDLKPHETTARVDAWLLLHAAGLTPVLDMDLLPFSLDLHIGYDINGIRYDVLEYQACAAHTEVAVLQAMLGPRKGAQHG